MQVDAPLMPTTLGDRSDLMAAIRATGGMKGAKLKKVEAAEERRKTEAEEKEEEPEDLMSSLAKALEKRRRGGRKIGQEK